MNGSLKLRTRMAGAARILLAYGLLPNAIFGLIALYLGVGRPMVNLDYLGLAILAPWLPRWLLRIGLGFAAVLDLLQTAAPTYQFSVGKILETTQDLFNLSPAFAGPIALGVLALAGALAWAITRLAPVGRMQSLHALLLAAAALGADISLSPNALTGMEQAVTQYNVAGSPGLFFLIEARNSLSGNAHIIVERAPSRASQPIVSALASGDALPSQLIMVVAESWGLYTDPELNDLIYEPLYALARQRGDLEVHTGSVDFLGSTVNGELRELCGLRTNSIYLPSTAIPLKNCLPWVLAERGYETVAIHGYRGSMFKRSAWYPEAGFGRLMFDKELIRALGQNSRCGATFPGICDGDIPRLIGQLLDSKPQQAQFIYWLTLNAHLPIYETRDPRGNIACTTHPVLADDSQQCRLVKLHRLVTQSIADLMSTRTGVGLVVVGDHAPAFVSGKRRYMLSRDRVPYAAVWPKALMPPDSASAYSPSGAGNKPKYSPPDQAAR